MWYTFMYCNMCSCAPVCIYVGRRLAARHMSVTWMHVVVDVSFALSKQE